MQRKGWKWPAGERRAESRHCMPNVGRRSALMSCGKREIDL